MLVRRLCVIALALVSLGPLAAAEPPIEDGTAEATRNIAKFRVPEGMKVELFAAEPQLGNPVAVCLDERNHVFVAEEYRFNRGTEENRTRPFLLDDDLQIRTLDDRLAMFKKFAAKFDGGMDWFTRHADQVRRLEDRDGDGKADQSTVFAGPFNDVLDGLAAGVLARDGDVFFTCVPRLWRLRDTDGDGRADEREVLHTGFGVNAAFLGHDLHGLCWGPDGKLYFSIGDRGFHVTTREGRTLSGPRTGAVFRCFPDGSELEVVHRGLRNPQELAFDEFGNLFADDNNCDKGDHSRLVYVIEGGDSGWNMAFQTLAEPYLTGPWHAEKMWHLAADVRDGSQPAWIVPAVGKLGAGPSGFAYYPGVGLPPRYDRHFFMCNYTGNGGVESFAVRPQGAGFEIVDYHDFFKPLFATDVEFGYDGKVYVSDYVQLDWGGANRKGRIYTLFDPAIRAQPIVAEVQRLFHDGFGKHEADELRRLLGHRDLRVRQRAQFALADRGDIASLQAATASENSQLARLHGLWGLGQIARTKAAALEPIAALVNDSDSEVRAHAVRLVGDHGRKASINELLARLRDDSPRARFFAAQSLGKLQAKDAVEPLFAMLAENQNADRYLRHAAVVALERIGDRDAVLARVKDNDAAVRLAVLLVLRRWRDERLAQFLDDPDVQLATEAARAINDVPLDGATPALARQITRLLASPSASPDALVRRVLNAQFRLGQLEHARAVATVAATPGFSEAVRREAVAALGDWTAPGPRDRVYGYWRPIDPRDPRIVQQALTESAANLLGASSGKLQVELLALFTKLGIKTDDDLIASWVADGKRPAATRTAALQLLAARNYSRLPTVFESALVDESPEMRAAALDLFARRDPERGLSLLDTRLSSGSLHERQQGFVTLAALKSPPADERLVKWLDELTAGRVAAEWQLDLLLAAGERNTATVTTAVQRYRDSLTPTDPLAAHRPSLAGGNAERGRALFVGHRAAQCIRCHKINGEGGDAGPDLSKIAARVNREYLLESLVEPNAKIAPGFGSLTVVLTSGRIVAGNLKSENDSTLVLETPTGKLVTVAKSEIDERSPIKSPMPSVAPVLTPRELRDVVEYLTTCK